MSDSPSEQRPTGIVDVECPNCGSDELQEVGMISYWCRGVMEADEKGAAFEPGGRTEYGDDYRASFIECSQCQHVIQELALEPRALSDELVQRVRNHLAGGDADASEALLMEIADAHGISVKNSSRTTTIHTERLTEWDTPWMLIEHNGSERREVIAIDDNNRLLNAEFPPGWEIDDARIEWSECDPIRGDDPEFQTQARRELETAAGK